MRWEYRVKQPDEKVRDPIQGEFFSTEAIKNPADALVREAIQNALDATLKDANGKPVGPVQVRFFLAKEKHAIASQKLRDWFLGAWEHLRAGGNGLKDAPWPGEKCEWLVYEDFNTTGLEGNIRQADPAEGDRNPFFHFFRAEGRSGKSGEDRGRWGVGKHVFPRSSRANAFFGLSVRHEDRQRILMGHSVFKSHWVGEKFYCPDGYFCEKDQTNFPLPITNAIELNNFSRVFRLKRTTESGLSVVVPWVDSEITARALIEATVREYFYPVLTAALVVTVETPDATTRIDNSTLAEVALAFDGTGDQDLRLRALAHRPPQSRGVQGSPVHDAVDNRVLRLARPQWAQVAHPSGAAQDSVQRALRGRASCARRRTRLREMLL